jgi:hypothetical protein
LRNGELANLAMCKFNNIRSVRWDYQLLRAQKKMNTIHIQLQAMHIRELPYIISKINRHLQGYRNIKKYKINTILI